MSWQKEAHDLARKRDLAQAQGGEEGVARQHAKGLLTVRERIDAMLDSGSFEELGGASGDATRDDEGRLTEFVPANYVLGFGIVGERRCVIGGEDFTQRGGSPNPAEGGGRRARSIGRRRKISWSVIISKMIKLLWAVILSPTLND